MPEVTAQQHPHAETQAPHRRLLSATNGYPFPMGPWIPLPDAQRPPLWPGLLQEEPRLHVHQPIPLNRLAKAARVITTAYETSRPRQPLTASMELAFRNFYQRVQPEHDPTPLASAQPALAVLADWAKQAGNDIFAKLEKDTLHAAFQRLWQNNRSQARNNAPQLFAPPHYPAVGQAFRPKPPLKPWTERYGEQTRQHVQTLLEEPAGEWTVLTLLFNKLLHAHMGWLATDQIRLERKKHYYRPLLQHLERCARQAGQQNASVHPLASTAAGIWQNLRRMDALLHDEKDAKWVKHPSPLDPRDPNLPDSLHMDSPMWVDECLGEAEQIFQLLCTETEQRQAALGSMAEVSSLAWEIASYRTDPFAMGGLGIAQAMPTTPEQCAEMVLAQVTQNLAQKVPQTRATAESVNAGIRSQAQRNFKRFQEDYQVSIRGIQARVTQLRQGPKAEDLDNTQQPHKHLKLLPDRFLNSPGASAIAPLDRWADQNSQLNLCYKRIQKMWEQYGLCQFQATDQGQ